MASSRALILDGVLFGDNYSGFCMSSYSDLKIQEVILDLNTVSYKIMRLPRWLSGKKILLPSRRRRFDPWGRKWQPTPAFLPGKSHGQRNLVGYSPWGHKELDTTERLSTAHTFV